MKKIFSVITMLLMAVFVLNLSACSSSDDEEGENFDQGEKTLNFNGEWYYNGDLSVVSQTRSGGMYLTVYAVEDMITQWNGKEVCLRIPENRVSELGNGKTIDASDILVQTYQNTTEIVVNHYEWDAISGSITIDNIKESELTLTFNTLVVQNRRTSVERTLKGYAVLRNSVSDNSGRLPFSES